MLTCEAFESPSRRAFLQKISLGGGAMLLSTLAPGLARADGEVDALLLTCMDYRLLDAIGVYMNGRGLEKRYDHVILAGASLGVLTDKRNWSQAFWEHVDIAKALHKIHKVIVIDHWNCGAYKAFLGEEAVKDPPTELTTHTRYLRALKAQLYARYPDLESEIGIMALDGKVQLLS